MILGREVRKSLVGIAAQRQLVDRRISHIIDRIVVSAIKVDLKRQYRIDMIDIPFYRYDAMLLPGPNLGRDIIMHRQM